MIKTEENAVARTKNAVGTSVVIHIDNERCAMLQVKNNAAKTAVNNEE